MVLLVQIADQGHGGIGATHGSQLVQQLAVDVAEVQRIGANAAVQHPHVVTHEQGAVDDQQDQHPGEEQENDPQGKSHGKIRFRSASMESVPPA